MNKNLRISQNCHMTYFDAAPCWKWRPSLWFGCSQKRHGVFVKNRMQLSIKRLTLFIDWPMGWFRELP